MQGATQGKGVRALKTLGAGPIRKEEERVRRDKFLSRGQAWDIFLPRVVW
jgi:hypothetical protein